MRDEFLDGMSIEDLPKVLNMYDISEWRDRINKVAWDRVHVHVWMFRLFDQNCVSAPSMQDGHTNKE